MTEEKRRRGRPPKSGDALLERINIRVPAPMMRKIEAISEARMDKPEKATVIRELLAKALECRG